MKKSILVKLSSALAASASLMTLSSNGSVPVYASLPGTLVVGSIKVAGKIILLPVKLAGGTIVTMVLPSAMVAGLGAYGLNEFVAYLTDEQVKLFSLDSVAAKFGYASKGNDLIDKEVTVDRLRDLVSYAENVSKGKTTPEDLTAQLKNADLLGLVKVLGDKKTWSIDGLEKIELEYLLDRCNDNNHIINKEDVLVTLMNARKDVGKAAKKILTKQKDNVTDFLASLFTKKVF